MFNIHRRQDYEPHQGKLSSKRKERRRAWSLRRGRKPGDRWQLRFHPGRNRERELLQEIFPYGNPLEWENGENPDEQFTFF